MATTTTKSAAPRSQAAAPPGTTTTTTTTNNNNNNNRNRNRNRNKTKLLVAIIAISISKSLLLSPAVEAFPSGAPEAACKTLKPGHGGEPSSEASPFQLTQDKLQVEAGDQIKVTLSSPTSKTTFKGLLVQALNEKGEPVGKFLAGTGLKLLDSCSAVTHSDREPKKTATLVWEAPADLKTRAAITFKATVVHKFDEFYMNIKSTLAANSSRRRRR